MAVTQLDAAVIDHGRLVLFDRIFQDTGQAIGRQLAGRRFIGFFNGVVKMAHAGAVFGRNGVNTCVIDKAKASLQLVLNEVFLLLLHAIPLVQGNHHGPTGIQHKAEQVQVLLNNPFAGIEHQHHHIGVFNGLQRLDHGELFNGF